MSEVREASPRDTSPREASQGVASRDEALFAPFAAGTPQRPFVVGQLGQSLDGRIATPTGQSKYINGRAALDHLHRLRAAVEAVLVGIGTALADDPALTVRRAPGASPARVVLDPNGRLPADARLLDGADGARRIVIRRAGVDAPLPPGVEVVRVDGPGPIAPARIVEALGGLGFSRILVEGGARTISAFVDGGGLDRLHVLVAPMILGSGVNGLSLRPIDGLGEAVRVSARSYALEGGDVLFDCDLKPRGGGAT